MNSFIKIASINLFILGLGILLLELVWHFSYANDIRFSVNVLAGTSYNFDVSTLYESDKKTIRYSRDKYGFRGAYEKVDEIDILVVGGSTADQRYIDDSEEWVYRLSNSAELKGEEITLVNAGVDGQSSYGHIKNFDLWFPQIEGLNPSHILFYIGLNDFFLDMPAHHDDIQRNLPSQAEQLYQSSFSYYVYRLMKGAFMTRTQAIGHNTIDSQTLGITTRPLLSPEKYPLMMEARLTAYLGRLRALYEKSKAMGAIPVFVTQRRNTYWMEDGQVIGVDKRYHYGESDIQYNGVDMYYMEKLLNETTLAICGEHSDAICIDLASEVTFERSDFYDLVHHTPSGSEKIARYLAPRIASLFQN